MDNEQTRAAVRPAGWADLLVLSEVLGRAFFDDPPFVWLLPDDELRRRKLPGVFKILLKSVHLPRGGTEVVELGGRLRAGAAWDPPNNWESSTFQQLRKLPALITLFGRHTRAGLLGLSALAELDKSHPREPHWYLGLLGTLPADQGSGHGSALLDSRLSRCDSQGVPAYLEASKEDNIGYYERFGFNVVGEVPLPRGGPTLYPMWRDPSVLI